MTVLRYPDPDLIKHFVALALAEDIGEGDHTTLSTIPESTHGKARLIIKEAGILAGIEAAREIFAAIDNNLLMEKALKDGSAVQLADIGFVVEGSLRSILTAERLVLNVMQRMSGIATTTHRLVSSISDLNTKLLDTRKTTPLFRYFEKWAVSLGGGYNHRFGLYDMILIKDNHVDVAGGIKEAIIAARSYLDQHKKNLKIEIETRTIAEVKTALETGMVDRIMLDNFSPQLLKEAITLINGKVETEASGGIGESTLRAYAETGVDYLSIGMLTHHVSSLDMSLKVY